DVHSADPEQVQRFRVSKFRVALVREGSIPTTWDKTVREPGDVARLMAPLLVDLDRETFWVVMLDGKNRVIGVNLVSVGSLNAAWFTHGKRPRRSSSRTPLPPSSSTSTPRAAPSRPRRTWRSQRG